MQEYLQKSVAVRASTTKQLDREAKGDMQKGGPEQRNKYSNSSIKSSGT